MPAEQLAPRPAGVPWEVAGSLFVAGTTAHAGVRAVALREGDTVAISGAAGGVGAIAVQLAKRLGVTVLGIAGPDNDAWLSAHGAIPVNHGPDLARRLLKAAPDGRIDAFLDLFGRGYLDLAIDELKIPPARANTTIDFAAASRLGAQAIGSAEAASVQTLNELATLIVAGELDVPIAATYPLADIQQAFRTLEEGHTRGKIVLLP